MAFMVPIVFMVLIAPIVPTLSMASKVLMKLVVLPYLRSPWCS